MNVRTRIGLALIVATFLLLNPAGACTRLFADASTHSCHSKTPVPIPDDCGRPGCAYLKASTSEKADGTGVDQSQLLELPSIRAQAEHTPSDRIVRMFPGAFAAPRDHLLLIHQLLI